MKYSSMTKTWEGVGQENKILRIVCLGLLGVSVMCASALAFRGETVVLIPPHLDERIQISMRTADSGYKRSWGLHVAQLMGNANPGNLDFILSSLGPLLGPRVFEQFKIEAVKQMDEFKRNGYSMSFQPMVVRHEPRTDKVFVTGRSKLESPIIGTTRASGTGENIADYFEKTFEFVVKISNGRPIVTDLQIYEGQPRTEKYIENEERNQQKKAEIDAKSQREQIRIEQELIKQEGSKQ